MKLEYGYGKDREPGVVVDVKYKNGLFHKRIDWGTTNLRNLYKKNVKTTSRYHICTKGTNRICWVSKKKQNTSLLFIP